MARENAEKVQGALYRIAELASAAQDMQEFYRAIHEVVGELMDAKNFFIALYDEERRLINWPYYVDDLDPDIPDPNQWHEFGSREARGMTGYVLRTGEPELVDTQRFKELSHRGEIEVIGVMTDDSTWVGVPLKVEGRVVGAVVVQSYTADVRYSEQDEDLLSFVGQHIGSALSRARAIEETRQRNAELALINSVQEALAGELEMQAIYDVVGDKIQEIFDAQGTAIAILDEAAGLVNFPYLLERGERLSAEPQLLARGFTRHVLETREPVMINENLAAEAERHGSFIVAGEEPKSLLFVPLVAGARATGVISLENFDREHAYDDADLRLLSTLAGSLVVALENARLVHETRQRNAELALINSVQEALAGELELQAIYDVVGDKIQEIFDAQVVDIGFFDFAAGLIHYPYAIERGVRYPDEPTPIDRSSTSLEIIETKAPKLVNDVPADERERGEAYAVAQGEPALSVLVAPLITGDEVRGRISLQNLDRTNAFSDSDVRLLTTLAGSLSVALENARLVHETRQRNAELALINSVQEALAGELELQAIYDAVGDRIRDVFDAQVVDIGIYDEPTGLIHFPYTIERGERFPDTPIERVGFRKHVMDTLETLRVDANASEVAERYGNPVMPGEMVQSVLYVPLVAGGRASGVISLQNIDRERAFTDSDQQLLETLAGSLSVALENARLVHETRQRNAELALINGVQEAIAGELDSQAIYDAVGDKIREIFDAQAVQIGTIDETTGLLHYPYLLELGERMEVEPGEPLGFSKHVLKTRKPLLIGEDMTAEAERYGSMVMAGESVRSVLFVPLVSGGKTTGLISLQNVDREHAFGESDQQLLETLAGSLSVALENARLVHETRQRNAELALINGVQDAIAGELDDQAIYEAVGDKIREIFDAQAVQITTLDETTGLMHYPYVIERGERMEVESAPPLGFGKHVLETRQPLMIVENLEAEADRYGIQREIAAGEVSKSVLFVPLVTAGKAIGTISLQNVDREHAFGESDQQLLETLAGSLSVALENARLVHETRQRNAELALINGVQDAIAGELDPQAIYDAVGSKIQEVFDAQVVGISLLDEATGLLHDRYAVERGERLQAEPWTPSGFTKHVMEGRESLLLVENVRDAAQQYGSEVIEGSEEPKSVLFVPLVVGGQATGVVSLQNIDREHAYPSPTSSCSRRSPAVSAWRWRTPGWCTRRGSGTPSWR